MGTPCLFYVRFVRMYRYGRAFHFYYREELIMSRFFDFLGWLGAQFVLLCYWCIVLSLGFALLLPVPVYLIDLLYKMGVGGHFLFWYILYLAIVIVLIIKYLQYKRAKKILEDIELEKDLIEYGHRYLEEKQRREGR